jgi:hypothetical protein
MSTPLTEVPFAGVLPYQAPSYGALDGKRLAKTLPVQNPQHAS